MVQLAVHRISTVNNPDTAIGMTDGKNELEFGNVGHNVVTNPRYMTRPDKGQGKRHSSIMIALTNKELYNK